MRWKKALRVKNVCSDTKYLEKNEDLEEFRSVTYLMSLVLDFFFTLLQIETVKNEDILMNYLVYTCCTLQLIYGSNRHTVSGGMKICLCVCVVGRAKPPYLHFTQSRGNCKHPSPTSLFPVHHGDIFRGNWPAKARSSQLQGCEPGHGGSQLCALHSLLSLCVPYFPPAQEEDYKYFR